MAVDDAAVGDALGEQRGTAEMNWVASRWTSRRSAEITVSG